MWLESQAGKGSNEVMSAMANLFEIVIFKRLKWYRYKKIELFSNSCGGQNRNKILLW